MSTLRRSADLGFGPGVRLSYEPKRKRPYAVWVEVIIGGKERRGADFYLTEIEGLAAFEAVCDEIATMRAEVLEDERRRKALALPELPLAPTGVTLFDPLARRWLAEHVKPMCDPSTYRNYAGALENHLLPIMRAWPVTDEVLTPQRLKDVLKRQLFDKGLSLATRGACFAAVSAMLTWALGELPPGQLTRNPLAKQKKYIRQESEKLVQLKQDPNPMTRQQADAFLAWIEKHRPTLYEYFLWLVDEGLRVGEVSALQWTDAKGGTVVDLEHGKAHIIRAFSSSARWMARQDGDREARGEKDTKTHRVNQYIDLSDRVVEASRRVRERNLRAWLARGRPGKEPRYVFLTGRLTPRRPDKYVYGAFRAACTALTLKGQTGKPFTIHCLRDTFATLAILSGRPLGWVSMMLGHEKEQTTKDHYYKWVRLVEENPLAARQEAQP